MWAVESTNEWFKLTLRRPHVLQQPMMAQNEIKISKEVTPTLMVRTQPGVQPSFYCTQGWLKTAAAFWWQGSQLYMVSWLDFTGHFSSFTRNKLLSKADCTSAGTGNPVGNLMPVLFSNIGYVALVLLVPLLQTPVAQESLVRQWPQCSLLSAGHELEGRWKGLCRRALHLGSRAQRLLYSVLW